MIVNIRKCKYCILSDEDFIDYIDFEGKNPDGSYTCGLNDGETNNVDCTYYSEVRK